MTRRGLAKLINDPPRPEKWPPFRHAVNFVFGVSLVAILVSTGCRKASPSALSSAGSNTNEVSAAVQTTEPVNAQSPTGVTAAVTNSGEPDLAELNRSLLRWILANRRRPASFADFAATANVTIPPPPAGKKYVLGKNMHIQLVNE